MKAILAINNENYIGLDNILPWRCSADLQHFKALTKGATLLVGYNTSTELPPLPGRTVIVDSRDGILEFEDLENVWCIGGKKTYEKYAHLFTEVHISLIDDDTIGDTLAPNLKLTEECKVWKYEFTPSYKIRLEEIAIGCSFLDRGGKLLTVNYMERDKICQIQQNEHYDPALPFSQPELHPWTEDFNKLRPAPLLEKDILNFDRISSLGDHYAINLREGCQELHAWFNTENILCINFSTYIKQIPYVHQLQNLISSLAKLR